MKLVRKLGVGLAVIAAAFTLTACQGVAVPAGQKAILVDDYAMIPTDPVVFKCQDPETSEYFWNVKEFVYPTRQISYDASDDPNAERPPYIVVSNAKAPAEMKVPVTVTFDLTDNCEDLKQFHRDFGTKYLPTDEDQVIVDQNTGWISLLNYVVGQPLEQTLISISQKYEWRQIWNDEKVRGEYVGALQKLLPQEAKARTNGKEYFSNFRVTVGKPSPVDGNLTAAITNEQAAVANARAAEAKAVADAKATEAKGVADANARRAQAEADVAAAQAETEVARQEALTRAAQIAGYPNPDAWLRAKCIEAGATCQMFNPAPVVVPGAVPR